MSKTELRPLVVRFIVQVGGKTYKPGTYKLTGEEYKALKEAPYVREATDEEIAREKELLDIETAARKAKGMKVGKVKEEAPAGNEGNEGNAGNDTGNAGTDTGNDGNDGTGAKEADTFTEEELRALPEADLRALYAAECEKAGKNTPPANIKVDTIIANLTK